MVDSSGLRLSYTPTLRKYDVDMVVMGTIMGIFVPPRTPEFTVTGFCHGSCSQEVMSLPLVHESESEVKFSSRSVMILHGFPNFSKNIARQRNFRSERYGMRIHSPHASK